MLAGMTNEGTSRYKRQHGLTVEQLNAIELLVHGETDAATAEVVGVHRVTVTKWRNYDPHFEAELNRRRKELWSASTDRLRALLPQALDALEQELQDGKQRGRVVIEILRLAGLDRSGPKGSSLETFGVGLTDPNEIIEARAGSLRPDPLRELVDGEPVSEVERASVLADLERLLAADA
jgi:hypothetical protein